MLSSFSAFGARRLTELLSSAFVVPFSAVADLAGVSLVSESTSPSVLGLSVRPS